MDPNSAEMNSLPMRSSLSRQNAGFTNVPSDDGSRQSQGGRNLLVGNRTGRYTIQGLVSDLLLESGTGHHTGQGFALSSAPPHLFSEIAPQQLYHGSQPYLDSSPYMEGNGTTGLNTQQAFAVDSVPEHDDSNPQLPYVSHLMVGNGTTGLNTEQAFALGSVPEHDDSNRQLPYVSHLMVGSGTTGLNTEQAFANLEQRSGSGVLQDICTPTTAPNQPAKTTNGTSNAESSRRSRQKKKEEVKELTDEKERLRKESEAAKRELEDYKRKGNAFERELLQLKADCDWYKKLSNQQQNQMQDLTKFLENMPSQQEEIAKLQGEITKLQEENANLKDQNDLLMQKRYGDPKGKKKWIKIHLQNRPYKMKNNILKLLRLNRED